LSSEFCSSFKPEHWHAQPNEHRRVAEIENKIGGGLLEEIVQVAQGENLLAGVMVENKVYVHDHFLFSLF
jgi:hypothetical protein